MKCSILLVTLVFSTLIYQEAALSYDYHRSRDEYPQTAFKHPLLQERQDVRAAALTQFTKRTPNSIQNSVKYISLSASITFSNQTPE